MNGFASRFSLKHAWIGVMLAFALCCCLAGCSSEQAQEEAVDKAPAQESVQQEEKPKAKKKGMNFEYAQQDLDPSYDESQAVIVDLTGEEAFAQDERVVVEGTTLTITDAGVYLLSGMLSDGQILVDAPNDAKVQLVLNNVAVHNEDGPAVYVKQAGKCVVTLAKGSDNSLTDGSEYALEEGEEEPFATLFSACDLTLNGSGALSVAGSYRNAVHAKGALVVTGGSYSATAPEDGLVGAKCVKICGGSLDVKAQADAVKSTSKAAYQGFVSLDGGAFSLSAGADAVRAFRLVRIMDGSVDIDAADDGVHSDRRILVSGGKLSVKAADDALRAGADQADGTKKNSSIRIADGTVVLNAGGNGLDSHGRLTIADGELLISGSDAVGSSAFEYGLSAKVNGGVVIATGAADAVRNFTGGKQPFAFVEASAEAGSNVAVVDVEGRVLASFTPTNGFGSIMVSLPDFQEGEEYSLVIGGIVENANASEEESGSTVSGGRAITFTASTTPADAEGQSGGKQDANQK